MHGNSAKRKLVQFSGFASIILLLVASLSTLSINEARAHEGGEAPWLPVHQVEGNLAVSSDPSLSQWTESHHAHVMSLDGVETDLMSVHNGTYWVSLAERPFNSSLNNAGVSLFLNGTLLNSSNAVLGWVGGKNNSTDPLVSASGTLSGGDLTVVFGRPLSPASGARFGIGVAYDDAIKVTSWNNGTAATSLNYSMIVSMGLEFLPHLDIFPKTPFVYGAVLIAGALGFVLMEFRRYRP